MPLPHDYDRPASSPHVTEDTLMYARNERRMSNDSIPLEECDGPVLDCPLESPRDGPEREDGQAMPGEALCTDRAELIERIKRGESPTWVPNQAVSYIRQLRTFLCRISTAIRVTWRLSDWGS